MYISPVTSEADMEKFLDGAVEYYPAVIAERASSALLEQTHEVDGFGIWMIDSYWMYPKEDDDYERQTA